MAVSISASNVTRTSCYVVVSATGLITNTRIHYLIDGSEVAHYDMPTTGTYYSHEGMLYYSTLSYGNHTLSCYLTRLSDGTYVDGSDASCNLYIQGYTMNWTTPSNNSSFTGNYLSVSGTCYDPDGIDYIYIYIDSNYAGYCTISGTNFSSNNVFIGGLITGWHNIQLFEHSLSGACNYTEYRNFYYTMARPFNWSWSYSIYSGGQYYNTVKINDNLYYGYVMPAMEWNSFTDRINQFRMYKGFSTYNFTPVSSGDNCSATIINQAINAINAMGFSIAQVSTNQDIPAYVFNNMRDSLNSL